MLLPPCQGLDPIHTDKNPDSSMPWSRTATLFTRHSCYTIECPQKYILFWLGEVLFAMESLHFKLGMWRLTHVGIYCKGHLFVCSRDDIKLHYGKCSIQSFCSMTHTIQDLSASAGLFLTTLFKSCLLVPHLYGN